VLAAINEHASSTAADQHTSSAAPADKADDDFGDFSNAPVSVRVFDASSLGMLLSAVLSVNSFLVWSSLAFFLLF